MGRAALIVLDTHVLLWEVGGEHRLGRKAKSLIERMWRSGNVAVSAISFWEIALLRSRDRVALREGVGEWREALLSAGLLEIPLDGGVGIRAVELGGLPNDPADRLIVATALQHRAALVTADERLFAWSHPLIRHDART